MPSAIPPSVLSLTDGVASVLNAEVESDGDPWLFQLRMGNLIPHIREATC